MQDFYKETKYNLHKYYTKGEFSVVAKMLNEDGYMANIHTSERTFYITTRILEGAETVIMEIAPEIHCTSEETIGLTSEYANKVNEIHVFGNVKISENGRLYIQTERKFDNAPLTVDVFKKMEASAVSIADIFAETLQKLANAKLLSAAEAEPSKVVARHVAQMEEGVSTLERLKERCRRSLTSSEKREGIFSLLVDEEDDDEAEPREPFFGEFLETLDESSDDNEEEGEDNTPRKMRLLDMLRKAANGSCEKSDDSKNGEVGSGDKKESGE